MTNQERRAHGGRQYPARNSTINNRKRKGENKYKVNKIPIMPTLTQTRAMAHAHSLAALNATAKNAATKVEEKKKNDKKKEEEEQAKIQQASEEKKRDAARLKAAKEIEKEAKKKKHATNVNAHLMELSKFDKVNEEEKDGASKTLFDKEAGSNSPVKKQTKPNI